jgi:hypothetical protein
MKPSTVACAALIPACNFWYGAQIPYFIESHRDVSQMELSDTQVESPYIFCKEYTQQFLLLPVGTVSFM